MDNDDSDSLLSPSLTFTTYKHKYYSSLTKTLNLKQNLPSWKEVKPK